MVGHFFLLQSLKYLGMRAIGLVASLLTLWTEGFREIFRKCIPEHDRIEKLMVPSESAPQELSKERYVSMF
jgi:hypothetical protein